MGESSAATSLRELMRLEEERQNDVRRAVLRRREADDEARREAERRAADAESAQRRAEDESLRAEEARGREEAARHRAMEAAAVEHERLAATARARAAEQELQRTHDVAMERIRRDAAVTDAKRLAAGVTALALAALSAAALLYSLQLKPAADRALAAAVADGVARDVALGDLRGRVETAEREGERASRELEAQRRQVVRLAIENAEMRRLLDAVHAPKGRAVAPSPAFPAPPRAKASCDPKDPMCFDLPK